MQSLLNTLSEERLTPYLTASGHNMERALKLYQWNMEVSSAFYPLLSVSEVGFRNCTERSLADVFGNEWWTSHDLRQLLGKKGSGILLRATKDLTNRGRPVSRGRLTAELSFGFWINMYLEKYEAALWERAKAEFLGIEPEVSQSDFLSVCQSVRDLRNRISHHETLLKRDLSRDFSTARRLMRWICPRTASWVEPDLKVMTLLRQKP